MRGCRSAARIVPLLAAVTSCATDADRGRARPLFTLLPSSETGVAFTNALPEDAMMNGFGYEYYYNGGGVAVGDLDGDGLPDLYFTDNMNPNRLYLNRGGLRFEDVTERAGVPGRRGWASGVTFADVNGDGRLDIHVCYSGAFEDPDMRRNALYINQGVRDGVPIFTEAAAAWGLDDPAHSTQAAFFDYDGDGDLDMYLLNHGIPGYRSLEVLVAGRSPHEVDRLYRNEGDHFVDVSTSAGLIDTNAGFGLGVSVGDVNNDGFPDIYVANDYSGRDYLYLGQPDGRFRETLEQSMGHIPYASMGSDIADLDGDGWLDVAVLEMAMETHHDRVVGESGTEPGRFSQLVGGGQHQQYLANALQWNRGVRDDGVPVFSEIAFLAGVARSDWSWAALFADLDNDGRPDLFATTGMAGASIDIDFDEYVSQRIAEVEAAEGRVTHSLVLELLAKLPRRRVANRAWRNDGDLAFTDRTTEWGLDQAAFSNGAVYADLDRDGDLDLVVNNLMGEAFIHRNNSRETFGTHFLGVRLDGPGSNRFGVGGRVRLRAGGAQQLQEVQLARGYQSSVEPVLHFGLGANVRVDTLEVTWPGGLREVLTDIPADTFITLDHRNASALESAPSPARLFSPVRDALRPAARHRAVLSQSDSTLAPYPTKREAVALAVGDLDGDGRDDFVFGASGGEPARTHVQRPDGTFRGTAIPASAAGSSAAAAIFDADGDGRNDVWLVSMDTAAGGPPAWRHQLYLNTGAGFRAAPNATPLIADAVTVLAPGDFDEDGDVDLFVGGHAAPGMARATSHLLRNDGGVFRDVTQDLAPALADLGTITAAVWADADGNGTPDLVIAGEWLAPTLLLNDGARLRDATEQAGLSALTGWWQSLAAADLDGDGDTDIVAGNMGLSHPVDPSSDTPFEVHVFDFDGDGELETVSAYYEAGTRYPWSRTEAERALPSLANRFPTRDAFGQASLSAIFGADALRAARPLQARTLASIWLENLGNGRFAAHALPRAAQAAPVMGIVPADFDGDGTLDLVIAGNLYALHMSVPRADAGVGLFLRGDGTGEFEPVASALSGLLLQGEVRGVWLVRIGEDGTPGILAGIAGREALLVRARTDAGS